MLLMHKNDLSPKFSTDLKERFQCPICVWTVNDQCEKQMMKKYQIAYMTDITNENLSCDEQFC
jgi:hypothetical protein